MAIFQKLHERVVHRFIDHAMYEHVCAFFHRGARGLQLGRVYCDTNFVRVTLFNRRADNRPKAVNRMIFVDNVPDLDQIRFSAREFPDEIARLLRSIDLHNRRIAEIEFLPRHARD